MAVGDRVLNFWPVVQPWQAQSSVVQTGTFQKLVSIGCGTAFWVAAKAEVPVPLAEFTWNFIIDA